MNAKINKSYEGEKKALERERDRYKGVRDERVEMDNNF